MDYGFYIDVSFYSNVNYCWGISLVLFNLCYFSYGRCVVVGFEYNWSRFVKFVFKKFNYVGYVFLIFFRSCCDVIKGFGFFV